MSGTNIVEKAYYLKDDATIPNYCLRQTTQVDSWLKDLSQWTISNLKEYRMLGAEEVIGFNMNIMKLIGAKNVLDVGVFTGYSTLAAALCVPEDGRVVSMDITDEYLHKGLEIIAKAGVRHKVDLRIQPAEKSLRQLIDNSEENTFDFAFIDADKHCYDTYYELCLRLIKPNGVIIIDNALWGGRVLQPPEQMSDATKAIHNLNQKIRSDSRVQASLINMGDGIFFIRKL